ncbi:MAG TPA: YoaK family protein [Myxococcales bacterium]|nr:YoaK family protein [Myxococcales bacterium]
MNESPASDGRRWVLSLLLLTFATGLVDAASVLGLGHVFTGNMTGNLLFVGFSLAGAHEVSIAASLLAVAGFIAGAAWGGRIVHGKGRRVVHRGFAIELTLLAAALAVLVFRRAAMRDRILLVLLAAALGIQGSVARRAGSEFSTVVLTSTLLRAATDTARKHARESTLRRAAAIAAMVAGAVIGALLLHLGLAWPIFAAALIVAAALSLSWSAAIGADR